MNGVMIVTRIMAVAVLAWSANAYMPGPIQAICGLMVVLVVLTTKYLAEFPPAPKRTPPPPSGRVPGWVDESN